MEVYKFGGASVRDASAVRNVASILRQHKGPGLVVVVSAMGKTTNALESLVSSWFRSGGGATEGLEEVRGFHERIAAELFPDVNAKVHNEINNLFVELGWMLEDPPSQGFDHHYDQAVAMGEMLSTVIISAFLQQEGINNTWVDARSFLVTDDLYREANVNYSASAELVEKRLKPLLSSGGIVVTQGFIGSTTDNYTTTLGREGSDYTAALIAYFCDASRVVIWKDVPGVLNADPKYFRNTKRIAELNYQDAIELTYYGASVIHPKTIKPLQNKGIPLYVRSFLDPRAEGTLIHQSDSRNSATSYIFKEDQVLISIQPRDFSFIGEENLSAIFSAFSRHHVHVHLMQNSAISFSICTDHDTRKIEPLIAELQEQFRVLYNPGVKLLTIRNYTPDVIASLTSKQEILLEQRSRSACQLVLTARSEM